MSGTGPFLWLSEKGSPSGYHGLPPGGMCLSSFVFITRGPEILLGKYADDPQWDALTGLDETRRRAHGHGWTIPASHLKLGEDPREAGRRVVADVLGLDDLPLTEPRVETEYAEPARFPGMGAHFDVWFFQDAAWPEGRDLPAPPPWYREWAFLDPRKLDASEYGRSHGDIVARWLEKRQ